MRAVGIGTTFLLRPFNTNTALLTFRPKNRLQFLTGDRPYEAYCDADPYMIRGGLHCSKHQIQPKTLFETRDVRLPVSGLWGKMLASIGIESYFGRAIWAREIGGHGARAGYG